MLIRKYTPSDCKELTELFYNTVHTINANDYTKEQINAWATGKVDLDKWNRGLQEQQVERQGIFLTNYVMEKCMISDPCRKSPHS